MKMYGYPNLFPVVSLSALLTIVKNFQVARPLGRIALCLKGEKLKVGVLSNGYVELDGVVPTLAVEREIDESIKQYGASLEFTNQQFCPFSLTEQTDTRVA